MNEMDESVLRDCFVVFEYYKLKIQSLYAQLNRKGDNHISDSKEQYSDRITLLKKIIYYFHKAYKLQNDINNDIIKNDKNLDGYFLRNFTQYTRYFEYIHKLIISEFKIVVDEEDVDIDYEFIVRNHLKNSGMSENDEILEVEFSENMVIDFDEEDENELNHNMEKFNIVWDKFISKMMSGSIQ